MNVSHALNPTRRVITRSCTKHHQVPLPRYRHAECLASLAYNEVYVCTTKDAVFHRCGEDPWSAKDLDVGQVLIIKRIEGDHDRMHLVVYEATKYDKHFQRTMRRSLESINTDDESTMYMGLLCYDFRIIISVWQFRAAIQGMIRRGCEKLSPASGFRAGLVFTNHHDDSRYQISCADGREQSECRAMILYALAPAEQCTQLAMLKDDLIRPRILRLVASQSIKDECGLLSSQASQLYIALVAAGGKWCFDI